MPTPSVFAAYLEVEGIVHIVNHQTSSHPGDRSAEVYTRAEFVESLTFPVTTTLQLLHAWRRGDLGVIRKAMFGDTPPSRGSSSGTDPIAPSAEPRVRRARLWRRRDKRCLRSTLGHWLRPGLTGE